MAGDIQGAGSAVTMGRINTVASGIVILPDTIKTVLYKRRGDNSGSIALACVGVAVTIWITFATASFKDGAGHDRPYVGGAFLIAGIGFTIATVGFSIRYLLVRNKSSVDNIVRELEASALASAAGLRRQ